MISYTTSEVRSTFVYNRVTKRTNNKPITLHNVGLNPTEPMVFDVGLSEADSLLLLSWYLDGGGNINTLNQQKEVDPLRFRADDFGNTNFCYGQLTGIHRPFEEDLEYAVVEKLFANPDDPSATIDYKTHTPHPNLPKPDCDKVVVSLDTTTNTLYYTAMYPKMNVIKDYAYDYVWHKRCADSFVHILSTAYGSKVEGAYDIKKVNMLFVVVNMYILPEDFKYIDEYMDNVSFNTLNADEEEFDPNKYFTNLRIEKGSVNSVVLPIIDDNNNQPIKQ